MTHRPFIALQHRNFRLLWVGLFISTTGSLMQNAAVLWHVSLLVSPERKALALGFVGLVRVAPIVAFSMISGVAADVWDRRKLMLLTQSSASIVAILLATLTYRGLNVAWPIYLLSAIGAAAGAFDLPARQSLVPMLVPREHLPNAISLNSILFQMASVLGPSLGGILIASASLTWVYTFNALSFLFVLGALLMMRDVPARQDVAGAPKNEVSLRAALDGLRFVFRAPVIRSTMLLDFFATFFSSATSLLPIFAQDILHVGAQGYGWLYAGPSVGALLASGVMVSAAERINRRGIVLLYAVTGYGAATVLFGLSRSFWLTFFCLAITGATDSVSTIIRNLVRQLETPDYLRGRMTGVNMVFFMGGPQLGELEAGLVANWLGSPISVITGGIGCVAATVWVALTTPALTHYRK
jgi:MFS family permease